MQKKADDKIYVRNISENVLFKEYDTEKDWSANSVDPDEALYKEPPNLDLCYL